MAQLDRKRARDLVYSAQTEKTTNDMLMLTATAGRFVHVHSCIGGSVWTRRRRRRGGRADSRGAVQKCDVQAQQEYI